jgi:transposase
VRHEIQIEPASPVDYAGDTGPVIVDRLAGQVRPAQIFVASSCHREASDVS